MNKFNVGDEVYYTYYTPVVHVKFRVHKATITEIYDFDGWYSYVTDKSNDSRCAEYTLFKSREELAEYYINIINKEIEVDESNLQIFEEGIKQLKQEMHNKKNILEKIVQGHI